MPHMLYILAGIALAVSSGCHKSDGSSNNMGDATLAGAEHGRAHKPGASSDGKISSAAQGEEGRAAHQVTAEGKEPVVLRLTWRNYNTVAGTGADAIYLLDGKEMGQGKAAFQRVLAEIGTAPRGSVLLVYPHYTLLDEGTRAPWRPDPYMWYGGEDLMKLVEDKGLCLVFSRDGTYPNASNKGAK